MKELIGKAIDNMFVVGTLMVSRDTPRRDLFPLLDPTMTNQDIRYALAPDYMQTGCTNNSGHCNRSQAKEYVRSNSKMSKQGEAWRRGYCRLL